LRVCGLKGLGGEEGVLATALNLHFGCEGPEKWHFRASQCFGRGAAVEHAEVQRLVEQERLPSWARYPLRDAVRQGRLVLCRGVPSPEKFLPELNSSDEDDDTGEPSARRRKRHRLFLESFVANELSPSVWKGVGLRMASAEMTAPGQWLMPK
jgi:hypothetical protein